MKIICCDICHSFLPLSYRMQSCRCKNIKGKYKKDGLHAVVYIQKDARARVIGIDNAVRYGSVDEAKCWIIKNSDRVEVKRMK